MQTRSPYFCFSVSMSIAEGCTGWIAFMPSVRRPSRIGKRFPSLWKIHGLRISRATIIW